MVHIQGSGLYDWDNTALVTGSGELLTIGSQFKSQLSQTQDVLIGNDTLQLLTGIHKELQKMNIHLESMTDIQINNEDVVNG